MSTSLTKLTLRSEGPLQPSISSSGVKKSGSCGAGGRAGFEIVRCGRRDGRTKRARDKVSRLDLVSDVTRGCGAPHVIRVAHSNVVGRQQSKAGNMKDSKCSLMSGKLSRK